MKSQGWMYLHIGQVLGILGILLVFDLLGLSYPMVLAVSGIAILAAVFVNWVFQLWKQRRAPRNASRVAGLVLTLALGAGILGSDAPAVQTVEMAPAAAWQADVVLEANPIVMCMK